MFVPKNDGKLPFCFYYWKLNTISVKESYPLPSMYEFLDPLGDCRIFTTLYGFNGCWQVVVPKEDRRKTSSVCQTGQLQYTFMPFGIANAPKTLQREFYVILSRFKSKSCLIYIDGIIIFSKSIEEHTQHVDKILTAIGDARGYKFCIDTLEYLRHFIKPGEL